VSIEVAFDEHTDTTGVIYPKIKESKLLDFETGTPAEVNDLLEKGRITAKVKVIPVKDSAETKYNIQLITSSASMKDYEALKTALEKVILDADKEKYPSRPSVGFVSMNMVAGRAYSYIDFLLPGMIGFSLIGSAIFGIAFSFFALKETLVLKRLYSTPIRRTYIVLGEGIARVIFQLTTVVVLIAFGYFAYNFTLANGIVTFFNMMLLSFLGLIVSDS
jgi:ABC-2 type transport system permease protein